MAEVLRHRRIGRYEMDVSGLNKLPRESAIPEQGVGIEVFRLPEMPFTQDFFRYRVVVDSNNHLFWIIRWGGVGGSEFVFGPGNIRTSSKYN